MLLVAIGAAWGARRSIEDRRAAALSPVVAAAIAAVSAARDADAMTWAPEDLLQAEAALRSADLERRVALVRLRLVPDLTAAEADYRAAEAAARRALDLTDRRRDEARLAAEEALAVARDAVAGVTTAVSGMSLGALRQLQLSRARAALTEAALFLREGDYGSATVSAGRARDWAARVTDHAAAVAARYADQQVLERWRRWAAETVAWSRRERRAAILVTKEDHRVMVYVNGELVKAYRADMGFNWVADKRHAGDGATPEGRYRVVERRARGATIYYKALLLDYPNDDDRRDFARARRNGELPASAAIGGLIEIHGEGGRGRDWTRGCVALTNADMDDLFSRVDVGTPVTIVGSDGPGGLAAIAGRGGSSSGER